MLSSGFDRKAGRGPTSSVYVVHEVWKASPSPGIVSCELKVNLEPLFMHPSPNPGVRDIRGEPSISQGALDAVPLPAR